MSLDSELAADAVGAAGSYCHPAQKPCRGIVHPFSCFLLGPVCRAATSCQVLPVRTRRSGASQGRVSERGPPGDPGRQPVGHQRAETDANRKGEPVDGALRGNTSRDRAQRHRPSDAPGETRSTSSSVAGSSCRVTSAAPRSASTLAATDSGTAPMAASAPASAAARAMHLFAVVANWSAVA